MKENKDSAKVMSAELVVTVNGVKNTYCVTNDLFEGMDDDNSSRPVDEHKYVLYKMGLGNWSISSRVSPKKGQSYGKLVAGCGKRIDL